MCNSLCCCAYNVHGRIGHLEKKLIRLDLSIRVHGRIGHLENSTIQPKNMLIVHGRIGHLETMSPVPGIP